jgi:hypothetical protein
LFLLLLSAVIFLYFKDLNVDFSLWIRNLCSFFIRQKTTVEEWRMT